MKRDKKPIFVMNQKPQSRLQILFVRIEQLKKGAGGGSPNGNTGAV